MTKSYWVRWEIEIDADNPQAAAEWARSIMLDPASLATVFTVTDESGTSTEVDLEETSEEA